MKAIITIIFLVIATSSFAGIFPKPTLNAVKGHIYSYRTDLDFTKIKVTQSLTCHQGWGDGRRECGTHIVEATVDKNGEFNLPEVKGDNSKWASAFYTVTYDGLFSFTPPYEQSSDNYKSIKALLENFSIYFIPKYNFNFSTDNGLDFDTWLATDNQKNSIAYSQRIGVISKDSSLSALLKVSPEFFLNQAVDKNNFNIAEKSIMIPGKLADVYTNFSIVNNFNSRYLGVYSSAEIAATSLKLNDENMVEHLENIKLKVADINYFLNGIWELPMSFGLEVNGQSFIINSPLGYITTTCVDNVLTGKATLEYRNNPELNKELIINGICNKGTAEFNMNLLLIDYNGKDQYQLNGKFILDSIAHRAAEVNVLDLSTNKISRVYGGIKNCTSITKNNNLSVCN